MRVCAIDADSGLCLGCFRRPEEAAGWTRLSHGERDAIMDQLPTRRRLIRAEKLGH